MLASNLSNLKKFLSSKVMKDIFYLLKDKANNANKSNKTLISDKHNIIFYHE